MSKSYTDQLADWVKKREKSRPRQDKGLVAFIAVKDDITKAIEAGYALKTIWEHLSDTGKIPYRYETFLKHIKRHIKNQPKIKEKDHKEHDKKEPAKSDTGPRKLVSKTKEFEVNPIAKKEDLI